jgi:hypothetical protein
MENKAGTGKQEAGTEKPFLLLEKLKEIANSTSSVESDRYPEKEKDCLHGYPFLNFSGCSALIVVFDMHFLFGILFVG